MFAHQFEQLGCASALGDDVVTGTFQEAREAFAKEDVVVGDNDALAAPSPVLLLRPGRSAIISHAALPANRHVGLGRPGMTFGCCRR